MPIPQLRNRNQNFSNRRIIVPRKVSGWKKQKNRKNLFKNLFKKTIFFCIILFSNNLLNVSSAHKSTGIIKKTHVIMCPCKFITNYSGDNIP